MALGLELGINQLPVHADLEAAPVRGNERDAFDQVLELLEQIIRQAHGPVGVMSDRTVNNLNFEHETSGLSVIAGGRGNLRPERGDCLPAARFAPRNDVTIVLENYNMRHPILGIIRMPRYNAARYPVQKQGESHARLYVSL